MISLSEKPKDEHNLPTTIDEAEIIRLMDFPYNSLTEDERKRCDDWVKPRVLAVHAAYCENPGGGAEDAKARFKLLGWSHVKTHILPLEDRVLTMRKRGYTLYEIVKHSNITELDVLGILKKNGMS